MLDKQTFFTIITQCLTMGYGGSRIARQLMELVLASGKGDLVWTQFGLYKTALPMHDSITSSM